MTASYTDLQDYTYYFVPAPWLSVKLLRLLQNYPPPGIVLILINITLILYVYKISILEEDAGVRGRLTECLETILNKAQEPPKSKKVQHSNAKNAVLFEAISLIIHADRWVYYNKIHLRELIAPPIDSVTPNIIFSSFTIES